MRPAEAISSGRPAVATVAGRARTALGTFCSLLVSPPGALSAADQILAAELAAIDAACSRFRPDSELSAVNRGTGRAVAVSPLFAAAVSAALGAAAVTDGDVDPTCAGSLVALGYDRDFADVTAGTSALVRPPVPAAGWRCVNYDPVNRTVQVPAGVMLDFGATAKALAADRAAAAIAAQAGCGVLVNLGGDIAVAGPSPAGGWRVEVADDVPGQGRARGGQPVKARGPVVAIEAGALATSSTAARSWRRGGRRLHHIVVPRTGRPAASCWAAVTVAAATCVEANTASTASIIRGGHAIAWLEGFGLPARLTRTDGTVATTGGWPA